MSLHTEVWKTYEDDQLVTYAFGPLRIFRKKYLGKVVIYKETGLVHIVEFYNKSVSRDQIKDYYHQRINTILNYHRDNGVYPDKTDSSTLRAEFIK